MKLVAVPMTLRKANDFVETHHRHNGRTVRDGGKFAFGASLGSTIVGVCIVGNPISGTFMDGWTAEVLRLCVIDAAPKGTCSFLYARAWQAWRAMGGRRIVTYTLQSESGASLRGAGWRNAADVRPVEEGWRKNDHLDRAYQPLTQAVEKYRWEACTEDFAEPCPTKTPTEPSSQNDLFTEAA